MKTTEPLRRAYKALASLKLTITCLALLMALVISCTLAQVNLGTYQAVKSIMRSFLIYAPLGPGLKVPIFPGGGLIGLLLLINLAVAQTYRLEFSARKAGLWVVHLGLILLFLGEFITGIFQRETQMPIDEGATLNYSESPRDSELVVIDETDPNFDEVYAIPESLLAKRKILSHPGLPFTIGVVRYFRNSSLDMGKPPGPGTATRGVGARISVTERPPVSSDDQNDQTSALVELSEGTQSLGTWLVSTGLGAPQTISRAGRAFRLAMRPARDYLPFSLTLKKFRHDIYPGTDIPRNFSSLVTIDDPARGRKRDVLISMNSPLRYGGKAFYQASFGKDDKMSVLQVVGNPGWLLPYLACILVAGGLLLHFLLRLRPGLAR